MTNRYRNGKTPEQQAEHDRRYRATRARILEWNDQLATTLGIHRSDLPRLSNAELVSRLLSAEPTTSPD